MARPLRIEYAGALYHVTSRGDRREDIYLDDEDRRVWLEIMGLVCQRFNWRCHAWCLMDNHYHLVIETIEGNLARGMRQLNGVYTQKSNRRHHLSGHLFQGRYKAILIDRDSYLLEVCRYVVLNPVRALMVQRAEDWQWSSYRAMIGKAPVPNWLDVDWLLGTFGDRRSTARRRYVEFVASGVGRQSLWQQQSHPHYLGDEAFIEMIGRQYSNDSDIDLREVPRMQRRPLAQSLGFYSTKYANPKWAMFEAYRSGDYSMKQIADWFGVHYSTVSRAVKEINRGDA